jgi:hypothetical protein
MYEVISAALEVTQALDEARNSNEFEQAPKTIPEGMSVLPVQEAPKPERPVVHLAPLVPSEPVPAPDSGVHWLPEGRLRPTPPPLTAPRNLATTKPPLARPLAPESFGGSIGPPLKKLAGAERRDLSLGQEQYAEPVRTIAARLVNSVIEPLPPGAALPEKQRYQREATTIKNLRLIWDNFPDYKQVIISEVCSSLFGLLDKQSPGSVGQERFDKEVVSSLRLAVERLFQERGQQIKDRLNLASRRQ